MVKTPNFAFELPLFDRAPWNQLINDNWSIIDAVMARFVAINNVKGVWPNATAVVVGDTYIDNIDGTLYRVLVAHTTASTGTFSADRAANTVNWILATTTVTDAGTWTAAKAYTANQFVVDANRFGITTTTYTSSTTYDLDVTAGNIITLANLATAVDAAAASATAAAASAAGVNLPSIVALNYLRGLADASGYEVRTAAQVLTDISAQGLDATLTALAAVATAADLLIYATGVDTFSTTTLTATARTLLDDASVAAMRTTLGLVIGTDVLPELAVVSQAVAEAGTATTERIWTAQRVAQAIAALETSVAQATQAAIEAETNENTYVPPDLVRHSPGMLKGWIVLDCSGTVTTLTSHNVTGINDDATGQFTVTWDTDFSSAEYPTVGTAQSSGDGETATVGVDDAFTLAAGSVQLEVRAAGGGTLRDPERLWVMAAGDQ